MDWNPLNGNPLGSAFLGHVGTPEELMEDSRTCRICLEDKELTKEHVPPQCAFNDNLRMFEYVFAHCKKDQNVKTITMQNGFWVRSLCKKCNNEITKPYAKEYGRLARQIADASTIWAGDNLCRIFLVDINVQYIMKEIAAMILSIHPVAMARKHPELRQFIIDPEKKIKFPFNIGLFHVPDLPYAGTISGYHGRVFSEGWELFGGEISGFPLGFVYYSSLGSMYHRHSPLEISHWANMNSAEAKGPRLLYLSTIPTLTDTYAGFLKQRTNTQLMFTRGH